MGEKTVFLYSCPWVNLDPCFPISKQLNKSNGNIWVFKGSPNYVLFYPCITSPTKTSQLALDSAEDCIYTKILRTPWGTLRGTWHSSAGHWIHSKPPGREAAERQHTSSGKGLPPTPDATAQGPVISWHSSQHMSTPQRKIYSLMIFVLIFDASEAFNFAVLKAPFFFSRIRSLTSLRLKKDTSAGSHAAIAAESEPSRVSSRISLPQALTGQGSHLPRETARPGPARTPGGGRGGRRGGRGRRGSPARQATFECRGRPALRPAPRAGGGGRCLLCAPGGAGWIPCAAGGRRRGRRGSPGRTGLLRPRCPSRWKPPTLRRCCRHRPRPHRADPLLECLKEGRGFFWRTWATQKLEFVVFSCDKDS